MRKTFNSLNKDYQKYNKQTFKIKEICRKYNNLSIESNGDNLKFYKEISGEKHLVGYVSYLEEDGYFGIAEFVTANFHKYPYSKYLFKVLFVDEKDFIDKNSFEENDFSYLGTYIFKYLIDLAKQKNYNLIKIINPDDFAATFYHKSLKLFKESNLIKDFSLPVYEKFDLGYGGTYQIKVINIKL